MLYILFVVGIFWFAIWFLKKRGVGNSGQENIPYKKKDYLLTENERKFFYALEEYAKQNKFRIFSKVRLEDLLWIPAGTENRFGWRNRIKSRHIDFVLCDYENIRPILAIELDDSSHNRGDRQERDQFVDEVLEKAGLKLLRFQARNFYNSMDISEKISKEFLKTSLLPK